MMQQLRKESENSSSIIDYPSTTSIIHNACALRRVAASDQVQGDGGA